MAQEFRIGGNGVSNYPFERFEMILRKLGFTSEDFNSMTLPELYLRLCIADPKGEA